jgi:hypothetical protein
MVGGSISFDDICGSHNGERRPCFDVADSVPAMFHAVFVGRFGHDVPESLVCTLPLLLQKGCPHILVEPVARVILLGGMLNQSYTLVIVI